MSNKTLEFDNNLRYLHNGWSAAWAGNRSHGWNTDMAIIIKCDPVSQSKPFTFIAEAPPYKKVDLTIGSLVFVWTSEINGGNGLVCRGNLAKVEKAKGRKKILYIEIDSDLIVNPLQKSHLLPYRDSMDCSPISSLSKLLYRHAHNKIAGLSTAEENFLNDHFGVSK